MKLEILKEKRKQLNLRQEDMVKLLGANYSRQCYGLKETGKCGFKKSEIIALKEIFQLTKEEVYDIFIGDWLGGIYDIRLSILRRGIKQKRSS